jgi:hypothetical protein
MKKFAIAAITASVALMSLSSVAEAGRRHHHDDDWGGHRQCTKIKIIKYTDWGKKVIIIKKCR